MTKLDELLDNKINITEDMEKRARNIYEELSTFLSDKLDGYAPEIFPQGSFKLGTIIRPTTGKDEYDLDFVCLLNLSKENINQNELYNLLGDTLRQKYTEPKLEPKKRCWRINFDKFHVDILPAIPDFDSIINKSQPLLIPDKDKKSWQSTNPLGYAEWFNEKRLLGIDKKTFENSIHPIPAQNNDFVLQKIVKLMKYHRNYVFEKDIENRPISMIVTTLAAMNYDGTQDLSEALLRTCRGIKAMAPTILRNNFIPNPVDEKENFADAWSKHPKRKENFEIWVDKLNDLENRFSSALVQENEDNISKILLEHFGYASKLATKSLETRNIHIISNPPKQWYK